MKEINVQGINYIDVTEDIIINIEDHLKGEIYLFGKNPKTNVTINLGYGSTLKVYELTINNISLKQINISEDARLMYYHNNINSADSDIKCFVDAKGNNSDILYKVTSINISNGKTVIDISNDFHDYKGINLLQDSIIYELANGKNRIKPILIISTNKVDANHNSYIGKLSEEQLYYLCSRGIDYKTSINLIVMSLLLQYVSNDYRDKFKMEIENEFYTKKFFSDFK